MHPQDKKDAADSGTHFTLLALLEKKSTILTQKADRRKVKAFTSTKVGILTQKADRRKPVLCKHGLGG